jgi:hypothetical protein
MMLHRPIRCALRFAKLALGRTCRRPTFFEKAAALGFDISDTIGLNAEHRSALFGEKI